MPPDLDTQAESEERKVASRIEEVKNNLNISDPHNT